MFSGFCNRAIRRHGPVGPRAGKRTESGAFTSANYERVLRGWVVHFVLDLKGVLWEIPGRRKASSVSDVKLRDLRIMFQLLPCDAFFLPHSRKKALRAALASFSAAL